MWECLVLNVGQHQRWGYVRTNGRVDGRNERPYADAQKGNLKLYMKYRLTISGGLPTRPTRPGLGAPKAQWPQRTGAHNSWKSPRVGAPRLGGPKGLEASKAREPPGALGP
jgi:hypothetical protein